MKASRLVLGSAAAASVLLLSACSPTGDVAVKVGDETFAASDIDLLTDFQCGYLASLLEDPAMAGQVAAVPRHRARTDMASILVASALDGRIAERFGVEVDEARLREPMAQLEPTIEKTATGEDRERLRELVVDSIGNGFAVNDLVAAQVTQESGGQATQEQVVQATFALRTDEAGTAGVEVDPVFGLSADGLSAGDDPSLSLTVSDFATKATASPPDAELVDALPAAQRCG